jgi:acyl-CoA synthetase (AMP-forming)/AMP-acid ligase II
MRTILKLHNPQSARDHYLSGVWQQEALYTLASRHARERPASGALPITASGKILKRGLVEMIGRGELAPIPVDFKSLVQTGVQACRSN